MADNSGNEPKFHGKRRYEESKLLLKSNEFSTQAPGQAQVLRDKED
jgi:hypothetical protein